MGTVQVSIQPHEMGTPRQSPIEEKRHTRVDLVRDTGLFACVVNIDAGLARRRAGYFSKQVKHIIVFTFQRITCLDSTSRDIRDS